MFGSWLERKAAKPSGEGALDSELARLTEANQALTQALETQTAQATEAIAATAYKAEMLQLAVVALQKRVDELEASLYLARSEQQRNAALEKDLRAKV